MGARAKVFVGLLVMLVALCMGGCHQLYEPTVILEFNETDLTSVSCAFLVRATEPLFTVQETAIAVWQLQHFWPELQTDYEFESFAPVAGAWMSRKPIPLTKLPWITWEEVEPGIWEFYAWLDPLPYEVEVDKVHREDLILVLTVGFPSGWEIEDCNAARKSRDDETGRAVVCWHISLGRLDPGWVFGCYLGPFARVRAAL